MSPEWASQAVSQWGAFGALFVLALGALTFLYSQLQKCHSGRLEDMKSNQVIIEKHTEAVRDRLEVERTRVQALEAHARSSEALAHAYATELKALSSDVRSLQSDIKEARDVGKEAWKANIDMQKAFLRGGGDR
jgi:uncharacterized protein HemX